MQTSGTSRRENADVHLLFEPIGCLRLNHNSHNVIARSPCDEAIQLTNRHRCEMDCFACARNDAERSRGNNGDSLKLYRQQ